jgi:hypothetical protein
MKNAMQFCLMSFVLFVALQTIAIAQQRPSELPKVITDDYIIKETKSKRLVVVKAPDVETVATAPATVRDANLDERNWNDRLKAAQERVKELNRRADQTELEINRLRNFLYGAEPRPANEHKNVINQISLLTEDLRTLRAEAARAQTQVDAILDEGTVRGFRVLSAGLTTRSGRPSTDAFRQRYASLNQELADLRSRESVLQLRANDIFRRILINSGTGDEFYNNSLRDDKYESQSELENTRLRIAKVNLKIEELREQARAIGIKLD